MSVLPKATPAPQPKTKNITTIALLYAIILVIMVLAQLFTFDDFSKLAADFGFPGGHPAATFMAAFLVITEVFALPFLLRMPLSPAFRWLSMVLGWLVAAIWLKISLWLVVQDGLVTNVGFLGTVVHMTPGWWAVFFSISLGTLAAWASWGMWPVRNTSKRVSKHAK